MDFLVLCQKMKRPMDRMQERIQGKIQIIAENMIRILMMVTGGKC